MSASPLITIGLPVFNGERFVDQAIESALAQTFSEFKLVVSDNASTDTTVEIVRDYAKRDHRIELIINSINRGGAWNFNRVFAESRSPYFRWAAADDMLAPTLLERSIEVLDSTTEDVVLVYPQTLLSRRIGRGLGTRRGEPRGAARCSTTHTASQGMSKHVLRQRRVLGPTQQCAATHAASWQLPFGRLRPSGRARTRRRVSRTASTTLPSKTP